MNKNQSSRRTFLKNTAVAGAGFFIVPRHVLGRGYVAPSDKLNIAGIGAGGKGESELGETQGADHFGCRDISAREKGYRGKV